MHGISGKSTNGGKIFIDFQINIVFRGKEKSTVNQRNSKLGMANWGSIALSNNTF